MQPDAAGWLVESQMKLLPCEHATIEENWDGHDKAIRLQPWMHSVLSYGPFAQPAATTEGHNALQSAFPVFPELELLHAAVTAAETTRIQRISFIYAPLSIRRGNRHPMQRITSSRQEWARR